MGEVNEQLVSSVLYNIQSITFIKIKHVNKTHTTSNYLLSTICSEDCLKYSPVTHDNIKRLTKFPHYAFINRKVITGINLKSGDCKSQDTNMTALLEICIA